LVSETSSIEKDEKSEILEKKSKSGSEIKLRKVTRLQLVEQNQEDLPPPLQSSKFSLKKLFSKSFKPKPNSSDIEKPPPPSSDDDANQNHKVRNEEEMKEIIEDIPKENNAEEPQPQGPISILVDPRSAPQMSERDLKKAFREFYRGLFLLQKYCQSNIEALQKILKKHDKNLGFQLKEKFINTRISPLLFYKQADLKILFTETEVIFSFLL
jgi:hypothetical protein